MNKDFNCEYYSTFNLYVYEVYEMFPLSSYS